MLRWQGNDGQHFALPLEHLKGLDPLIAQEKYILLARGIVPHQSDVLDCEKWISVRHLGAMSSIGGAILV